MKSDLIDRFEHLGKPQSTSGHVPVEPLHERPLVLIGKSPAGKPLFLFESEPESTPLSDVKLENILVRYSQEVLVALPKTRAKKGCFSIIEYTGIDSSLQHSFLQVIGVHVDTLRATRSVSTTKIAAMVQGLVDLFKTEEQVQTRNSLQGLWAELLLLSNAKNIVKAAQWWSARPDERVDFQSGRLELEVKSSCTGFRVHTFSQEQIPGSVTRGFYVASVLLSYSDSGVSLDDLVTLIRRKLENTSERAQFETKLYLRSGGKTSGWDSICYDAKAGIRSLKFFEGSKVPRIRKADRGVIRVRCEVELSEDQAMSDSEISRTGDMLIDFSKR